MRRTLATTLAAVLLVQVGVTPFWASDAARAAMALEQRTISEALDAAEALRDTAPADDTNAAADAPVIAEATLTPETPVTVTAEEVGATATFSGFEVDEDLSVEVTELSDAVAASASSELAAVVITQPFEIEATTASGGDVSEFPADPTFATDADGRQVVVDVDPGLALQVAVPELAGIDPASVRLVTREAEGDPWLEVPSFYDETSGAVVGESDHLSQFAVIGVPFTPPPGPRIVLDPDDDVGFTVGPNGPATELPLNVALANQVAAKLNELCLAQVVVTRPVASPAFLSTSIRAGIAAAQNPQVTVTLAFNTFLGYEWTGVGGGSRVYSRGGAADNAIANRFVATLPDYTGRPARLDGSTVYPYGAYDGLPGAMVHLETLFIDHSQDRAVIDTGFEFIVAGVATAIGQYAEGSLGADCTDPVTGGWPAKPSAATLAQWKQLGYHYHQTYMADPVSMSTGNLVEDEPLFTLTGPGTGELNLTLVYNSQDGRESRVGTGWSFGLGARAQRFDDGSVLVVRGDGASVVFNSDGAGGYTADADVHETLAESGLGRLTLTAPSGETWVFDAADIEGIGELVSYRDALGQGYMLSYSTPDADDRFVPLASITDMAGQTITVTKNAAGQIATLTHPDGRTWSLGYGGGGAGSGDLVSITNPDGRERTFTYDAAHRMLTATDAGGVTYLRNEFDASGRVTRQWDADGNLREFDYTGTILTGGTTVYTNNEGHDTTYVWDEFSRVTAITDAEGATERFEYDAAGNVTAHIDALGFTTEYDYDADGNLTRETLPDGTQRSYTYTPLGIVASMTDAGGPGGATRTTTFDVTPTGLTTAAHLPDGTTVAFTYTDAGDLASVTDQAGHATTFAYDAVGNLTTITDALGQVTTNQFDAAGRVIATTDPTAATTTFQWDATDRLISTTDALGAVTTFAYNATDQVTSVTDPLGAVTGFAWDDLFHLIAVTSPDGAVTEFEYDTENNLTATIDARGARTVIDRDAVGRPIATTDPLGNQWRSAYDAIGRLTAATDPLGAVTEYAYDEVGRLVAVTDAAGFTTTSVYDAVGRLAAVTDAAGGTVAYFYTLTDQLASVTDQAGQVERYRYDEVGNLTTVIDRRGQSWRTTFDEIGRTIADIDPVGATTRTAYDAAARTITSTDPLGAVTATLLDALGRVTSVTDALGAVTTATYDAAGRLTSTTDANGAVSSAVYDATGRVTEITDAVGAVTAFAYDPTGNLTRQTSPLGVASEYEYDPAGQLTRVIEGYQPAPTTRTGSDVNVTTAYSYTPTGQLASITDAVGAVTRFTYDERGLPTAETNPLGITTRTTYDALGRPVTAVDGNGGTTRMDYTRRSDVASIAYPDGTQVGFDYDAAQNPIVMRDALGATGWVYDRVGRLTRQTDPNGAVVSRSYDLLGRTATLSVSGGGLQSFAYDAVGQLTSQSSPFGSLTSTYDPVGNLIGQVRSSGLTTDYTHDAVGRVTQIAHHTPVVPDEVTAASWVAPVASPTDALQPCPAGEAEVAPGDEPEHVTSYLDRRTTPAAGERAGCKKADEWGAARDFPTLEKVFEAGESIVFDYTYDAAGNVTSELETLGSQGTTRTSYLYDDLDRLTQSLSTDGVINGYAYDPVGNRTGWVSSNAPDTGQPLVVASQFNAAGQVTSQQRLRAGQADTSVVFEHDRNGNRVAETVRGPEGVSTTRSTFTSTGRVASITEGEGTPHRVSSEFAYDGLGRQLTSSHESWAGHSTQAQVWDGLQVIQQSSSGGGSGGVVTLMRDAAGQVAVQSAGLGDRTTAGPTSGSLQGRGATWSLHDVQGSTIATTTATGRVTDLVDYSDFGIPQHASAGFTAMMGFTGESTDASSGLHHYFARSYDSFTATWASPDPYRGTLTDPASQGRYGYVGGNPTSMVDVLGFRAMAMHDGGSRRQSVTVSTSSPRTADGWDRYLKANPSVRVVAPGVRSAVADRHPPVCANPGPRGQCLQPLTQEQRDNAQTAWAIVAGIGVGLALTACIVATAGICGAVAAGGIASVMIAGAVVGAASSAVTYGLMPGEKTPEGWLTTLGVGAGLGALTAGIAPAVGSVLAAGRITAGSTGAATTAGTVIRSGGAGPVIQGGAGVNQFIDDLTASGGEVLGQEISVRVGSVVTRPDLYVRLPNGTTAFVEVKTGASAALTRNQAVAYPAIRAGEGAVPIGSNAARAQLPVGEVMDRTPVWEVRMPWPLQ